MSPLDRYRVDPPSDPEPCPRHPRELRVYAAIPITPHGGGEPVAVRGWTCPQCFTRRGFTLEAA